MTALADVPEILSNVPGTYPYGVWRRRHPRLLARIRDAHLYPPHLRDALDALCEETVQGVITALPRTAHDHGTWDAWCREHLGKPWPDAPFLWAEGYFYRRLLEAVDYFRPGPWFGHDPFGFLKTEDLQGYAPEPLDDDLPEPERAQQLLLGSLWGNLNDLGFKVGGEHAGADAVGLVADESAAVWGVLRRDAGLALVVVADNAGQEIIADLILIDFLLATGRAGTVALHVKPQPTFVSDATTSDVHTALRLLPAPVADRLRAAAGAGRLTLDTHAFYCAPYPYDRAPADLLATFAAADLTILKGDLNYRRLVGDRHWPATTPIVTAAGYFPGRFVTLRTLKSDALVGVAPDTLAALDATGEPWRTTATHALVQTNLTPG
ncbi:damage-control phosphatase ARMT1 family protein [Luedemannella helvata]|uniref:Damage-control phosphatase ARMT1 family protein n=1 Tax=Luedemannella helvata TaxID=349315 RepID=A0ABN2KQ90_9ACTN